MLFLTSVINVFQLIYGWDKLDIKILVGSLIMNSMKVYLFMLGRSSENQV